MMSLCQPNNFIHHGVDFSTTHILDPKVSAANADYSYVLDSVVDPDPYPYPNWIRILCGVPGSVSGSKRAKWLRNKKKQLINFIFWRAGRSILRAEGFSCNLNILCGGLFCNFYQKKKKSLLYFFYFWSAKPYGIQIRNRITIRIWIQLT